MKIAHIADTHIRNLKYHEEYKIVFEQLYKELRENEVDLIIHCGDIAHSKNSINPEFVSITSDFLKNLSKIATTYIILGNHDGNLKNLSREDAISPIISSIDSPNLILKKYSETFCIKEHNLRISVFSVFDSEENWLLSPEKDPGLIDIAVYHGAVNGVVNDIGFQIPHADHDASIFDNYDYGFLGDIHKSNQIVRSDGKVRYPGSTIQQNFGENQEKGFLLWDIKGKNEFECRFIPLVHPRPFLTIKIDNKDDVTEKILNKSDQLSGGRIRIEYDTNFTGKELTEIVKEVKKGLKTDFVVGKQLEKGLSGNQKNPALEKISRSVENIRKLEEQEKLLKEFLKNNHQFSEDFEKLLFKEHKDCHQEVLHHEDELGRGNRWTINGVSWGNLYNFGEKNVINFSGKEGVIGLFGKNFSGKSSTLESILLGLFNKTSKDYQKSSKLVNNDKQKGWVNLDLEINEEKHRIERVLEKKINSKKQESSKSSVDYYAVCDKTGDNSSKNEEGSKTYGNIASDIGSLENFLMLSMASQHDAFSFINQKSTKRKELLANFLDLDFFELKHEYIKSLRSEVASQIKMLSKIDQKEMMEENFKRLETIKESLSLSKAKLERLNSLLDENINKNKSIKEVNIVDLPNLSQRELDKQEEGLIKNIETVDLIGKKEKKLLWTEKKEEGELKSKLLASSDSMELLMEKKRAKNDLALKSLEKDMEYREISEEYKHLLKDVEILDKVPCGKTFVSSCLFLQNARKSEKEVENVKLAVKKAKEELNEAKERLLELEKDNIDERIEQKQNLEREFQSIQYQNKETEVRLEKLRSKRINFSAELEKTRELKKSIKENQANIEKQEKIRQEKELLEKDFKKFQQEIQREGAERLRLEKETSTLEEKNKRLQSELEELDILKDRQEVLDILQKAFHSNGISYQIIENKLPVINEEIEKILSAIVPFRVLLKKNGKDLDILIQHNEKKTIPLELASGSEKSIAGLAIRFALRKITTLPKSDFLILDEPGTDLDSENREGLLTMLEEAKNHYRIILIISHLDFLKECVDEIIEISKDKDGYAHIEHA